MVEHSQVDRWTQVYTFRVRERDPSLARKCVHLRPLVHLAITDGRETARKEQRT